MEPVEFVAVQGHNMCSDNLDNLKVENNCLPLDPFEMEERKQELTDALRYCIDLLRDARVISDLHNSHGTISRRSQFIGKKIWRVIMDMLCSMELYSMKENEEDGLAECKKVPLSCSLENLYDLNREKEQKIDNAVEKDSQCVNPQKVLPLAVIRDREAKATAQRLRRQHETDQQKSNRLKKLRDAYWSKKDSSNKEFNDIESNRAKKRRHEQNLSNNCAQDSQCGISKEVLSLAVIKTTEAEAIVQSTKTHFESNYASKPLAEEKDIDNRATKRQRSKRNLPNKVILKPKEIDIITQGQWITDDHMDHFHTLVRSCSDYEPVGTWRNQLPQFIPHISKDRKHIQILHSSSAPLKCTDPQKRNINGHWAFDNVHSAQIISEGNTQQSSLAKSFDEISQSSFSEQLPSASIHNNSSITSLSDRDLPFHFSLHSSIDVKSEEDSIEFEDLKVSLEVDVEDFTRERVAQLDTEFEKPLSKLEDEIKDLIDAEAVEVIPLKASNKIGCLANTGCWQWETQPAVPQVKTEDRQSKNPLFILLRKNGLFCQELIDESHRNNFVPEERDINVIAKIVAKHLLNLAFPPKRKVLSSSLTRWGQYFKRLFPKAPTSSFYTFYYKPSTRNGILIQKKRAGGALQVQLFQERRKLIKEDRTILLRRPSADSNGGDRGPLNVSIIKSTWRPVGQQGETLQPRGKVATTECHPELQEHLHLLCNPLQNKHTPELAASWKATFNYRRKLLVDQSGTVWDYLNHFPFLKINDLGKAFICKDFDQLCPKINPIAHSGKLAAILDDRRLAIIKATKAVLKEANRQEDRDVATSYLKLAERDSDFRARVTGALLLLPFIFPNEFVEKSWKPTRLDVVDSFIARVCSEADIKEYIERRRKSPSEKKTSNKISFSVQPYVLAVGPTWERINHVHIIVDQVLYTCQTIIGATELCFKLFHAFHTDYPAESKHVWQLIQQGFYKLFVKDHYLHKRLIAKALANIGIEPNTEEITNERSRSRKA